MTGSTCSRTKAKSQSTRRRPTHVVCPAPVVARLRIVAGCTATSTSWSPSQIPCILNMRLRWHGQVAVMNRRPSTRLRSFSRTRRSGGKWHSTGNRRDICRGEAKALDRAEGTAGDVRSSGSRTVAASASARHARRDLPRVGAGDLWIVQREPGQSPPDAAHRTSHPPRGAEASGVPLRGSGSERGTARRRRPGHDTSTDDLRCPREPSGASARWTSDRRWPSSGSSDA